MITNYSNLKNEIENAIKLSETLDDPHKTIFKSILKSLSFVMDDKQSESILSSKTDDTNEEQNVLVYRKLLEKTGIVQDQLENVLNFEKNDFKVVANINGENEIEKQIKASLIILTANYYCYEKEEINSRELASKLRWLGIKSLANLNKNLKRKECQPFIRIVGKGNNTAYQILNPGLKKGIEIMKEMANEEGI